MNKHERKPMITGGKGIEGWIQPACSCGWRGAQHYAHNDWQHTNATEEWDRHCQFAKEVDQNDNEQ